MLLLSCMIISEHWTHCTFLSSSDLGLHYLLHFWHVQVPLWFPLNIITGGNLAKMVVGAMGNEWGKSMAQGTLTRDLGNAVYKVMSAFMHTFLRQFYIWYTELEKSWLSSDICVRKLLWIGKAEIQTDCVLHLFWRKTGERCSIHPSLFEIWSLCQLNNLNQNPQGPN